MSAEKQELRTVIGELSEDESIILLRFAEWLKDSGETLSEKELSVLRKGEQQIRDGEFVWWRDIKRSDISSCFH